MGRFGWRSVVAALVGTAAVLVVPWPAAANPWTPADEDVANNVDIAANLDDQAVAFVSTKGHVRLRRPPDPTSTDLGQPTDLTGVARRPTELTTSAGVVFRPDHRWRVPVAAR